jgi:hypothetical protein
MGKVYVNQTAFTVRLTTGENIAGATELLIKYIKPDGTTGSWVATENDATEGIIEYTMADADQLDQVGWWTFWAYVTFSDGSIGAGEPVKKYIHAEGD